MVGSHRSGGLKHIKKLDFQMAQMMPSCTPILQKVAKSMDNNNGQLFGDLQPNAHLLRATIAISRPSEHWCISDTPQKAVPVKADPFTYGRSTMVFC